MKENHVNKMCQGCLRKYITNEQPKPGEWELFEEANNYNCYDLYLIIDEAMGMGFEVKVFDSKVYFREVA